MTSGPTYGAGFVEIEPRLSQDFLRKINSQIEAAFSGIRLDLDQRPFNEVEENLRLIAKQSMLASDEMAEIAHRAGASIPEFREMAKTIAMSEEEARRLATQLMKASEADATMGRLNKTLGGIRTSLTQAAGAAIAFFGIRGVLGAAGRARDSFIALEESVNAVEVVFGDASDTIFAFSDQVATSAGLARSEFQQMSTVLGGALQNAGFAADEAAAKTITLTQRAADMASVFNTDVSDALGAIQAALRGETDPIEKFSVTLSAAAVDAQAAALGYQRVAGEFDVTAKTAARLAIIMEQTQRVAGDFANTSDSLANRQRAASSAAENLRAELGEKLLPVYEALVDAGPEILEGLEDLAPSLQAFADSAANLGKSTPGVLDMVDILRTLMDLPRGFGQLFDIIKEPIAGLGDQFAILGEIVGGDLLGAFDAMGESATNATDRAQSGIERVNTQGLIDDLRAGADGATEFANRLAIVGQKGKIRPEFIRALQQIAGIDATQAAIALQQVVANAEQLGLSADDVAALEVAFAGLRNTLFPVGNEAAQAARAIAEQIAALNAIPDAVPIDIRVTEFFSRAALKADELGISLGELVFGADDAGAALLAMLDPSEQILAKMQLIGDDADAAATVLNEQLAGAIGSVSQAFVDANKDMEVSAQEFFDALVASEDAQLDFEKNLARIVQVAPALAAKLREEGAESAGQVAADFAGNLNFAEQAEAVIQQQTPEIAQFIDDMTLQAVSLVQTDPAALELLEAFAKSLQIPGLYESIEAAIAEHLPASLEIDVGQQGAETIDTWVGGMQEQIAAREDDIRRSILNTFDRAIERKSPPKIFLEAGRDSGDAFWSGFAGVPVEFPGNDLTSSFRSSRAAIQPEEETSLGGFGAPAIGEVNIYNPIGEPAEESLQEGALRAAVMLNLRRGR